MKNSGVEWIGEIPEEWESIRLKYIYSTTKAKLPKQFYDDKNLTPYLSMDFIRDSINTEPVYAKDGDYCSEEDILILWDGSNAGEIVFNHPAGYAPSTTAILKKLSSQSLPVYDKFYLKALEDDLRRNTNGMGIPHVNGSYLNNSLFLLPPKSTQQRVASYLEKKCSKIEETIQNQQQVIEKLKAYKQSLITEAVTGKIKIQNGKVCGKYENYKDSGVEWIGKIPSGWISTKISYLTAKIGSGKTPNGGAAIYRDEGILFIRSQNVYNEGLLLNEPMFISDEIDDDMKGTRLVHNDVLLNITGGSIGRCCVYEEKFGRANVNQHVCIIRVIPEKILPKFMQLFWISKIGEISIDIYQTGGNREGMSGDAISKTFIPLPTMDEQIEIANYLDKKCAASDTAIEQKQKLIEKLTEYKKSLIYECVTGKKEVN